MATAHSPIRITDRQSPHPPDEADATAAPLSGVPVLEERLAQTISMLERVAHAIEGLRDTFPSRRVRDKGIDGVEPALATVAGRERRSQ